MAGFQRKAAAVAGELDRSGEKKKQRNANKPLIIVLHARRKKN